jgi:hypothetical protein
MNEKLWEHLIETLRDDLDNSDHQAIYELLDQLPVSVILKYLPEEKHYVGN